MKAGINGWQPTYATASAPTTAWTSAGIPIKDVPSLSRTALTRTPARTGAMAAVFMLRLAVRSREAGERLAAA